MADFAVAHLAVGESDEVFAGAEEGVRVVAQEAVVGWLAGLCDGVAVGLGAIAPAVEDGEDDGFGHAWQGYQDWEPGCGWLNSLRPPHHWSIVGHRSCHGEGVRRIGRSRCSC